LTGTPADDPAAGGARPPAAVPTDFSALGVAPVLVQRAAERGWTVPTAIQAAAWPAIARGRDVLGQAPTGSGKTAAWLLPLVQRLLAEPGRTTERPRRLMALVLAPTRELALQIGRDARALAPQHRVAVLVGGVSANPQMMALRGGAHLAVATPGRLLDLAERHALRLDDVELLVLDEADRLLDLGFADELQRILALLPRRRQALLFSATLPDTVARLAAQVLHDPQRIEVGADADRAVAAPAIAERVLLVDTARRTPLLRHLIAIEGWPRVLVFVASQYASEHVADKLRQGGIAAAALHGGLSAGRRQQVLADFSSAQLNVLVATDLAARGLHVPDLGVVVQHELPRAVADYTHRIGRTGRAGATGTAISFVCADAPGSEAHFRRIEDHRRQRLPREQIAGFEPVAVLPPLPADSSGGIKGRRKSKKDKAREAAARQPPGGSAYSKG
jgi:superfamily II DNA/RNA helicase